MGVMNPGSMYPLPVTTTPTGPDSGYSTIATPDTETINTPEGVYLPDLTAPASVESPVWTP